jgi:hypothetical protein
VASVVLWIAAMIPQHDGPHVHVQEVDGVRYFQLRLRAPSGYRLPKSQRQPVDRIALHDLGRYPRLIPLDGKARLVAWYYSPSSSYLEFNGLYTSDDGSGKFRVLVPLESDDKDGTPQWFDQELTLLFDDEETIRVTRPEKRNPESPTPDDLPGRWAAAWAREFAVRERLAHDSLEFRVMRQELCRQMGLKDPMPRPLPSPAPKADAVVPLAELRTIEPADHPWQQLLTGRQPRIEPLARIIPADFYYFRLRTYETACSFADQWIRDLNTVWLTWDGEARDRQIVTRIWQQLALPTDDHRNPRWPKHVREAAITGSDFHFVLGTDVTILFAVTDAEGFRQEIEAGRQLAGAATIGQWDYHGVPVQTWFGNGNDVRQHVATVGGLTIVSNSPAAVRRIIDVVRRQAPSVADTPEFRTMRALFPTESPAEDALLFLSETFLREQFNPRHRILLKRRQDELIAWRLARAQQLFQVWRKGEKVPDLTADWETPLIERPLERITKAEDEWYQQFVEEYRQEWKPYLAPAALRLQARDKFLRAELFVMATRQADFWDSLRTKLGSGTVGRETVVPPGTAARVVASVKLGEMDRARLNQWLMSQGVDRKHLTTRVDWMGDRVVFHLPDSPAISAVIDHYWHIDLTAEDQRQSRSDGTGRWLLAQVPATLSVDIARPLFFQGTLKKVREIVEETWPKTMKWEPLPDDSRRVQMTRIQPQPALLMLAFGKLLKPEETPGIYFAHGERTLVIASHLDALQGGIAREMLSRRREERERAAAWWTLFLGTPSIRDPLLRIGERSAQQQALAAATYWQWFHECGIRDTPDAWSLMGFIPQAPDGSATWTDRGEVANQRHGSPRQPRLQEASQNSPWAKLLQRSATIRGEMHVRPDGLLAIAVIGQP